MTALVPSRWLWLSLSIRSGEEGRPCDYPSTNSRAQSGHHGPGKTCNHAVLQHLPREPRDGFVFPAGTRVPESASFDLAYQRCIGVRTSETLLDFETSIKERWDSRLRLEQVEIRAVRQSVDI